MQRKTPRRAQRWFAPGVEATVSSSLAALWSWICGPASAAEDGASGIAQHPAAIEHLPFFITAPGQTDVLMVAMAVLVIGAVLGVGVIFLTIHTLPERLAHRSQKLQFEIVAVLGLLALFTHIHLFWVAGLLLALVELPDFSTPLARMARALERLAGIRTVDLAEEPAPPVVEAGPADEAGSGASDGGPPRPASRPRLAEGA